MRRILCGLVLILVEVNAVNAAEARIDEGLGYNLSMAGALINDRCERNWQSSGYISIYACNYQFAQLYNFDISSAHFSECAAAVGGDVIRIADCMVERFNAWIEINEVK